MKYIKLLALIALFLMQSNIFAAPPIFDTIGDYREMSTALFVYEGNNFSFTITAQDPDGDQLTYWTDTSNIPSWIQFNTANHTLYGVAPYWSSIDSIRSKQHGIFDVAIYVSDGVYTVERIFTLHILDSLWESKTIQELVAERPVEPQNSTIGTPVQLNIINDQIISSVYGGGKNVRKITFSFKSQTPTLDSLENDWLSTINYAYLPENTPSVENAGALVEGCYSEIFGEDTLGEKTCAELDIPVLVIDRGWYWDYPVEIMDKYHDIAFQTHDPHYLFYVFSSAHFMRSVDALITVIDSLTNWQVTYNGFKAVLTGHSKFGHTCYVAAALDSRVVGIIPSGASILESGGARLLGDIQGATGTKPDAFYDYKGLMMRYYIESIEIEPQIDTSVFILQILGTDDDKNRSTGYTPKYVLLESSNHLTHDFRTGCIPNAPHTTQTTFHETYWKMGIAHCLLNRDLSSVDSVYYYDDIGNLIINCVVKGNPTTQNIKVWATSQSDIDTSAWNGFTPYNTTQNGNVYQAQIPSNSTAYFVQMTDIEDNISGTITSQPTPVNRNYPQLFLPPRDIDSINIVRAGFDITLSWQNPNSSDYVGTIVVYNTTDFAETALQGTVIFDGNAEQFTHTISDSTLTYYYTVFCYDSIGDYSSGVKINSNGYTSIPEISNNDNLNLNIYPNPFSESVNIQFYCNTNEYVDISIYDVSGKKVKTIYSNNLTKGNYNFIWNGTNNQKNKINSGTYYCVVRSKKTYSVKKIIKY